MAHDHEVHKGTRIIAQLIKVVTIPVFTHEGHANQISTASPSYPIREGNVENTNNTHWWSCGNRNASTLLVRMLITTSTMGIRMELTPETQKGPAVPMPTLAWKTLVSTQTMVYVGAWKSLLQLPVAIYWLCFLVLYSTFSGLTVLDSRKAQSCPYAPPGETLIFFCDPELGALCVGSLSPLWGYKRWYTKNKPTKNRRRNQRCGQGTGNKY